MFSIGFLTLDLIIWIGITIGFFFLSLHSGKRILAKFILSFYPTTLIFSTLPWTLSSVYVELSVYVGIYALIFIFLYKNFTAKSLHSNGRKTIDGITLSISSALILLIIYYHIAPISELYSFTLPFSNFLTESVSLFIWMAIPLVVIALTNKSDE